MAVTLSACSRRAVLTPCSNVWTHSVMSYGIAFSNSDRSRKGWRPMAEMTSAELSQAVTELAKVLTALQGSADQLIEEMEAVRVDSSEARQVGRRARLYSGVAAVVAVLVLLIASTGVLLNRQGETEQAGRDRQTAAVIEAIQACTSPGHECYDQNQIRSNQRLAPIISVLCANLPPEKRRPPCPAE